MFVLNRLKVSCKRLCALQSEEILMKRIHEDAKGLSVSTTQCEHSIECCKKDSASVAKTQFFIHWLTREAAT